MASTPSQVHIHSVEPADGSKAEAQADDALLKLFWNRAELKKEFARMRNERATLQDRIRHQEGQILRVQQRLEQLEGLLADPAQAVQLALYYQLRALWSYGQRRIARLVREQTPRELQHEKLESQQSFLSRQQADLADMDARLAAVRSRLDIAEHELAMARRRRHGLRGLLRREQSRIELASCEQNVETLTAQLHRQQTLRDLRAAESLTPESQLSVAGKRRINLAAIAMAQELAIQFSEGELAIRARDAAARQFKDVNNGSSAECRKLSRLAAKRLQELESKDAFPAMVERRAHFLGRRAEYRSDGDAVPVTGSVATMPRRISATLEPQTDDLTGVDVLTGDYWELYSALLS